MKKFTWIIAIAIIGAGALFFLNNKQEIVPNNKNQQQSQENQGSPENHEGAVLASASTISQADSFYNISADYPQFTGVDASFNNEIEALITDRIDSFKQEAKDNWEVRNATLGPGEQFSENPSLPFDFIASWKPVQVNDEYVSFVISIGYYSGGANASQEVAAFNYDVVNNQEITITDFLRQGAQDLQSLSQISRQKVAFQLEEIDVSIDQFLQAAINAGTMPTAENFKEFNFTSDSLIIYFQKYQVAPGAAGPITITIGGQELAQAGIASDYFK